MMNFFSEFPLIDTGFGMASPEVIAVNTELNTLPISQLLEQKKQLETGERSTIFC